MMKLHPIYARLEQEQYEWLRRYCFENRVAQAEVIREALDMFRNQKEVQNMAGGIRCYGCDQDYTEGYWLEVRGEDPTFYCRECAEEANFLGKQGLYEHGPNDVIEVVVLETAIDHTEPIERFRLVVPSGDEKSAVKEAIAEVEARGYTVIADDQGGCNEYVSVTDGEDYIAVTVAPNAE